jgi:nanoRNase/pAp phosphatase (c-di-AMP/oligoRNAs hydrolase)/CBS domain-containing protein
MNQIIATHKNTDFDALASLVAAKLLYPDAVPVLPRQINPNVKSFLSIHKDLFDFPRVDQVDLSGVDRLIVVDANAWSRLDRMDKLRESENLSVELWDHHPGDGDLSPVFKCCKATGANITLMTRALKQQRIELSSIVSTLFLIGLYEDTGNLTFSSCCPEDAYTAGYLLEHGADLALAKRFLSPAYGRKQKEVLFELLKKIDRRKVNGYRIGIGKVTIQGHVQNLAMVVHMFIDIANLDAAFGLFDNQDHSKCMVIGRSVADTLDIGAMMRSMGGGGHSAAGSAVLKGVNPDAIEEMILNLIQGNQQTSVRIVDLMSFPVISITSGATMREAARKLRDSGCTGLPVMDDGSLVGILSRRDFKRVRNERQFHSPVKAFMSTNVKTIGPGESPMAAAQYMVKHDIGRLPVIQDGRVIGIVTRSDAMRYFYDLLPD